MNDDGLSRTDLAQKIGISIPLVSELINAHKPYPSFSTVIKIANSFNTSIDLLLNEKSLDNRLEQSWIVSEKNIVTNLKKYIRAVMNITPNLATDLGVGINTIKNFLDEGHSKKILSTAMIFKLSKHLDVSIDEMIGRTIPVKELNILKPLETISKKTVSSKPVSPVAKLNASRNKKDDTPSR
jgi:plasmid maintenance system antidote protein VapI